MPPPVYSPGTRVKTRITVPVRICLKKGYMKTSLPIGQYSIITIVRNEEYWHNQELSDGYTYQLKAARKDNPLYGRWILAWQNDLNDAILGIEDD